MCRPTLITFCRIETNTLCHSTLPHSRTSFACTSIHPACLTITSFRSATHRRRRNRRRVLLPVFSLTVSFRIIGKHIEHTETKLRETTDGTDPQDHSVLEKLLRIDKQTAHVMALDMLIGGVDTVSAIFQFDVSSDRQNNFGRRKK